MYVQYTVSQRSKPKNVYLIVRLNVLVDFESLTVSLLNPTKNTEMLSSSLNVEVDKTNWVDLELN